MGSRMAPEWVQNGSILGGPQGLDLVGTISKKWRCTLDMTCQVHDMTPLNVHILEPS